MEIAEVRHRIGEFLGVGPRSPEDEWVPDVLAVIEKAEGYKADAEAYRALLADTRHQIRFDERGWTIKHPMAERIKEDRLFECPATLVAQHLPEPPEEGLGTYYFSLHTEGNETTMEIEEKVDE